MVFVQSCQQQQRQQQQQQQQQQQNETKSKRLCSLIFPFLSRFFFPPFFSPPRFSAPSRATKRAQVLIDRLFKKVGRMTCISTKL